MHVRSPTELVTKNEKIVSDLTKKGKEMEPSRIRAIDLLGRIERGEETVLIDTRNKKAWAESDQKLPGALRIPANEIELHTHKLPRNQLIVSYCS